MPRGPTAPEPTPGEFVLAPAVVIRPTDPLPSFVYQSAPSGPVVMPQGFEAFGSANRVNVPVVVSRTMQLNDPVYQRLPSGPVVIPPPCDTAKLVLGAVKLVTAP